MTLRTALMLRIVAVATFCCAAASAYVLEQSRRETLQSADALADITARQLGLQLWRISSGLESSQLFPDWSILEAASPADGQCIRFITPDGLAGRAECHGWDHPEETPPNWFSVFYRLAFGPGLSSERTLMHQGRSFGSITVAPDADAVVATAWQDVRRLAGLTMLTILGQCLLIHLALGRGLRPVCGIVAGLRRLAAGDLAFRLPARRQSDELRTIGDVVNQLAESLERTTAERAALTARLVTAQEEERRHLVRELHDEFGQCLTALGAVAASMRLAAEETSPHLLSDAVEISSLAARMMDSLRSTLRRLRPPGIDELGLIESLHGLLVQWKRYSGGAVRADFAVEGRFDDLPTSVAVNLYRIVQESLTNVARHSSAASVRIILTRGGRPETVRLRVEDDGAGTFERTRAGACLGLLGIQERVAALGGQMTLESCIPTGWAVHVVVPVPSTLEGEGE